MPFPSPTDLKILATKSSETTLKRCKKEMRVIISDALKEAAEGGYENTIVEVYPGKNVKKPIFIKVVGLMVDELNKVGYVVSVSMDTIREAELRISWSHTK